MKLKITNEETRTICQFVVDGLVCVISKENNSDEAVGFVKGVKLFSGKIKNFEETAKLIKKEIENNKVNIEKRIKIGRKKMGIDNNFNPYEGWELDNRRDEQILRNKRNNRFEIINIVKKRNITKLIHFTDIRNMPSILEHGILPPARLKEDGIESHSNDPDRFDNQLEGISVSIMKRNQHVLNYFHKRDPRRWIEIEINPDIVATKNCLFYQTNASNSKYKDVKEEYLRSSKAFASMFDDCVVTKGKTYKRDNKKSFETTDEQAEIIVRWKIPKRKILSWKEINV